MDMRDLKKKCGGRFFKIIGIKQSIFLCMILLLILSSCAEEPAETPTPSQTATITPIPTDTPLPTATMTPTATPTPNYQLLNDTFSPLLQGKGVEGAAEYDPEATQAPRVYIISKSWNTSEWYLDIPVNWRAESVEDVQLVVIVDSNEVHKGSMTYRGGTVVNRYQWQYPIDVRNAKTGKVVAHTVLQGPVPGFPYVTTSTGIGGDELDGMDMMEWLMCELQPERCVPPEMVKVVAGPLFTAFSSDGESLAVGRFYLGTRFAIINSSDGEIRSRFRGPESLIQTMQISADGALLASGHDDETVYIWRTSDWELLHTLVEEYEEYQDPLSLAFSPDGELLAAGFSGYHSNTVRIWRVSDGSLLHELEGHDYNVIDLIWLPDGKTLASRGYKAPNSHISEKNEVILWDTTSGELLSNMNWEEGRVYFPDKSDQYFADNAYYADVAAHSVVIKRSADDAWLALFPGHEETPTDALFSPNRHFLATMDKNCVLIWDMRGYEIE